MNLDSVEQLHVVLQQSFSPDVNQRGPAEEAIRNLKNVPGSTTLLLKIASEKQVSKISWLQHVWTPVIPRSIQCPGVAIYLVCRAFVKWQ
jgi:hypothetical protein